MKATGCFLNPGCQEAGVRGLAAAFIRSLYPKKPVSTVTPGPPSIFLTGFRVAPLLSSEKDTATTRGTFFPEGLFSNEAKAIKITGVPVSHRE
jgi:hypothetical protein